MSNVAGPSKIDPGTHSELTVESFWRLDWLM